MTCRQGRSTRRLGTPSLLMAVGVCLTLVAGISPSGVPAARAADPASAPFRMPTADELASSASQAAMNTPLTVEQLPSLDTVYEGAKRDLDSMPEADWEIPALAEALEYDPERAFTFVRDSIGFDPYQGVLRGAAGTLAARAGNADDRALLLAALLDAMQVPVRFASGDLDDATLDAVIAAAARPPVSPLHDPGLALTPVFQASVIQARAAHDYGELRGALGTRLDTIADGASDSVRSATRHHVWLQRAFGTGWQDLDPTLGTATPGTTLVPPAETMAALPDASRHTVAIRLESETLVGDALETQVVLDKTISASDAGNQEIFLLFRPAADGIGGTIAQVLTGDVLWVPELMVDGQTEEGQSFQTGSVGTDVFGDTNEPGPPLTALRLVIEATSPGRPPTTVVRSLLDRVPAAARAAGSVTADALGPLLESEAGPLVMGTFHHIMISTGGTDLRDFALQRAQSTGYANAHLMDVDPDDPPSPYGALWPLATSDRSLVVASEAGVVRSLADASGARGYVAAPRVFIATFGRDTRDAHQLAFQTDLAIDGVDILPGSGVVAQATPDGTAAVGTPVAAADLRLWYGTLQTALESQMALTRAALIDPDARTISGISFGSDAALRVLEPDDAEAIPPGSTTALRADLASGALVLVRSDDSQPEAWWSVDPATGAARSMLDEGLGGARPSGVALQVGAAPTYQNSYTHGAGPRHAPRPPMQRPPPGSPGYGSRGTCVAASEDSALNCAAGIGYMGFALVGIEVLIFALIIAAIL